MVEQRAEFGVHGGRIVPRSRHPGKLELARARPHLRKVAANWAFVWDRNHLPSHASPMKLWFLTAATVTMSIAAAAPPTERKPVTDEYHGEKVVDDYRWLEESGSPAVKAWTAAQNQYSREWLDARPDRAAIEAKLTALYAKDTPSHGGLVARPGRLFALKFQPPKQQRLLVTLASADDLASEKVVLDPNELEPKGQVAMDWFVPSPDGKSVAVCLSENGSEEGTLHFYRTDTGEHLADRIPRVQYPTGGGSAAWTPDGTGIFYTRYPHAGERAEADLNFFQQIYFHQLGTPTTADVYSAGRDFPRIAEISLSTSKGGRWLLASVANGDGGEFAHYVRETREGAAWRQITRFEDGIKAVAIGRDDATLFLRSVKDAPRGKVLRLPLAGELREAEVIVPESEAVIEEITPTRNFLFTADLVGGPSRIRQFDLAGKIGRELPLPAASGVGQVVEVDDRLLFRQTSFVAPAAWMLYDPADGTVRKTALFNTSPVDFSEIEAVREWAVSKDGTKIPLNILRRKGSKLDGRNPVLLTGYGGYGHSLRPGFNFEQRLWFERGGVFAIGNIRGGGEYGEAWHLAGNLTHKQNVFDDFAACAEHLIARGYTRPEKLAVEGGSNGGLLMGAFLTQHPALARAVVAHVGIFDMLRVELDPNGAFNITEFGTVKNPAQFRALRAYSPFHNVLDGARYPAVFFLAGEADGRVNPANSRKMTARLQAATASEQPILVRLSSASGHGMGTALTERISQQADVFAFLFDQLGMSVR
jgi:prolyl oligopeptidase